jgi:hypothetical protein
MTLANLRRCEDRAVPLVQHPDAQPTPRPDLIPVGFYATPSRTGANEVDFWKVERPDEGRWAGRTFVKRVLGGGTSEQTRTQKISFAEQVQAQQAINQYGVEESGMLYAARMGRCRDCNRDLTDDESIRWGRGRICRERNQGAL